MSFVVERTCTELADSAGGSDAALPFDFESKPLSAHRETAALVLLGDPGSGKSTEFDRQSRAPGAGALMVSARDFITLDPDSHPEWSDRILFIDGLDEMRVGRQDSRLPLDELRNRLDRLRPPGFRISCREADWLGQSDRQSLQAVSPDSRITVLSLDELDERQVMALLRHRHNRTDGQAFITEARQRGVGGLLVNPLTLGLLADALRQGGDWPDSRRRTLEMACRQIATEHNQEHRVAKSPPPLESTVDAAGYLCALQLLAGFEGYVAPRSITVPSFMSLTELRASPSRLRREDLEHALATKLFRADREGFVPLHRQVAEFLAGRCLAKLIDDGLPARRVIALLTSPSDERVVTSLRGLSAWLAAHSRRARPSLIDADPIGVGLYGDLGDLSTAEKEHLLQSLAVFAGDATLFGHQRRDGRVHGYRDDTAWAFRSLATADMVPTMRDLLGDVPSGDERLAMLMLEALANAEDPQSVVDLGEDLEAILWGESRSAPIRRRALDAYLHVAPSGGGRMRVLRRLLDAVQDGSVPDPDDQVRGILLEVLYPEEVTPSEVWDYARPRNEQFIGRFSRFWSQSLFEASSDEHLAELLDSLHEDASRHAPVLVRSKMETLPEELLARCLEANGDHQDPERVHDWLTAAGGSHWRHHRKEEPARRVRAWLEARPHLQKQVVLTWLRQRDHEDSHGPVSYWFWEALHGSTLPADFGMWCLDQAVQIGDDEPEVSEGLLLEAYRSLHEPSTSVGLTLEEMRDRTRGHPVLARHLDEFCERGAASSSPAEDEFQREMAERREQWDEEQRRRCEDWASHLREQEDELWENRFSSQNLATLANVYLGHVAGVDRHASPRDRISEFIGGDPRLVNAVMAALQGAASRDDLPEVDQTISWSLESRHSLLAYPVLASLELLDTEDPERLDGLQDEHKRKALAIYYCVPDGAETPLWHARWLQRDAELVLDVLYRCAVADVRAGKEVPSGLNDLDAVEDHDNRVHDVRLRLLEAFPTRSSNKQLPVLDRLLTNVLDHSDRRVLLALAKRKQASKSMPVAQRVRWWATDALIVQGARMPQLKIDLAESEVRIRHLAEFLRCVWDRFDRRPSILAGIRDPSTLRELIEIMGCWFGASQLRSGRVTLDMEMSDLIGALIRQLGSEPGDEAQWALVSLVDHPGLEDWHPHLTWALEEQRVIHRDASYDHPNIEQVQDTLNDGPPANAADLKALLVDRLDDMCDYLRGGSSDFWSQFWNEEQHRMTGPKPEDSCRDALLTNLRLRLPDDVDAQREGSYAADARADIRASHGGFNVPVEIKKDCHRDLWKAVRGQLMAKYTTDPATEGNGIYLILWFADADNPVTRHPGGARPSSPKELRQWLEQDLSPEEARKISVIVMDVTKPGTGLHSRSLQPDPRGAARVT